MHEEAKSIEKQIAELLETYQKKMGHVSLKLASHGHLYQFRQKNKRSEQ